MTTNFKILENDLVLLHQSSVFDSDWYESYYRDVEMIGIDPAEHYLWLGWRLKRRPSENANIIIDAEDYLSVNPDVAKSGIHPIAHYLAFGIGQGRRLGKDATLD